MSKKILVVEDEPGILLSLSDELESAGYRVFTAENGEKALEAAGRQKPDLIILDIMLPVLDGYEVCKKLRMRGDRTPIIMLTVKDTEIDKVLGLELGADDYMTKPFSLRELTARVKAVFRRMEEKPSNLEDFSFGGIELDFKKFEAAKKGKKLELTPVEFHCLSKSPREVMSGAGRTKYL
jgi:two-component system alkaline phosphatase synthesis response regulator PhoP